MRALLVVEVYGLADEQAGLGQIVGKHEDHARHAFLGKDLQEQVAQAYDAGRITFSGVGAFFASLAQALGGPPSRRAAQGRPPPKAARSVCSSSNVASG